MAFALAYKVSMVFTIDHKRRNQRTKVSSLFFTNNGVVKWWWKRDINSFAPICLCYFSEVCFILVTTTYIWFLELNLPGWSLALMPTGINAQQLHIINALTFLSIHSVYVMFNNNMKAQNKYIRSFLSLSKISSHSCTLLPITGCTNKQECSLNAVL